MGNGKRETGHFVCPLAGFPFPVFRFRFDISFIDSLIRGYDELKYKGLSTVPNSRAKPVERDLPSALGWGGADTPQPTPACPEVTLHQRSFC